jgi:quaternary ammonium compound-resistance protein SugE
MEWIMLLIAGVLEVTWAVFMKMSEGFTKMLPSIVTAVGYILSAVFLALALKKLPLGTAYAMWTGFGILGTTLLGVMLFRETISPAQAGCVILIAAGIVGLRILA